MPRESVTRTLLERPTTTVSLARKTEILRRTVNWGKSPEVLTWFLVMALSGTYAFFPNLEDLWMSFDDTHQNAVDVDAQLLIADLLLTKSI